MLIRICPTNPITRLLFSPDGHHVVSRDCNGSAGSWDVNNHGTPRQLPWTASFCWLPNTPLTGIADGDPEILLRNAQTGEHQFLIHDRNVHPFGISSCRQGIAVGCENYVHVWHSSSDDNSHTWRRVGVFPISLKASRQLFGGHRHWNLLSAVWMDLLECGGSGKGWMGCR